MKCIKGIYSDLGFSSFDPVSNSTYPQKLEEECKALAGYKRNQYQSIVLDDELKGTIRQRWSNQFQRFGYDLEYNLCDTIEKREKEIQ